jgi:hypothetical protein
MIDAKQIPDEVVVAVRRAAPMLGRDEVLWLLGTALAAWPEAEVDDSQYGGDFLILPLTKEGADV